MRLQQQQAMQMEKEAKEEEAKKEKDSPSTPKVDTPAPTPAATPAPAPSQPEKTAPATAAPSKPVPITPVPAGVAMAASSKPIDVDAFQRDFNVDKDHWFTWRMCAADLVLREGVDYASDALLAPPPRRVCPETAKCEQPYQLSWFGRHLAPGESCRRRAV